MKRGRRDKRELIQSNVLEILNLSSVPLNISSIRRQISQRAGAEISWNTVQKYLDELVQVDKVQPISLPHSKKEGKDGLTIYTLKR